MRNPIIIPLLALILTFGACSLKTNDTVVATQHNPHLTLGTLADIAPGLGTVMMEYSHRFYVTYYAAKAGNWNLAKYELHEMLEIQEVGEATRPEHARALKTFEENYLSSVEESAETKSWQNFDRSYRRAVIGCNACHAATGHGFIRYKLPSVPPKLLDPGMK